MSETGQEPESAIFDVTRVGSGRGRPPVLVLGFAGLLAGVVALGVTGRSQAEPVGPVAVATASPTPILIPGQRGPRVFPPVAPATTSSAGQTGIRGYLGVDVVELAVPHRDDEIVRGSTVTVSGSLRIHAATLLIQIQGADQAVLASQVIDTANRDGGIRPLHSPSIDLQLEIPSETPQGRLWLVVTAFNEAGDEVGSMLRTLRYELVGAPRL